VVGRTMFETDRLPSDWVARCNGVHELWVPSRFNVETFSRAGVEPSKLRIVPEGVDGQRFRPGVPPLPWQDDRSFHFLSIFDWQFRKGWDLLLRAYLTEFHRHEDVALVLKVYQYNLPHRNVAEEIAAFAERETGVPLSECPPVILLRNYVSDEEMPRLYAAADAFVLPTRGEGWGRPMMEAMACGLPTIATKWGGHLDFMHEQNAYLIDCQAPVPVSDRNDIGVFQGHCWAEPDVDHLRRLMRHVYTHREEAKARGACARQEVAANLDLSWVRQLFLQEIRRILG
jgi:glycosyltransferase involved in cell wall biosynthesis